MVRLPSMMLPEELQDPAAWDTFLSKLNLPPTQHASQLPALHTAQSLVPAHLLAWLRWRMVYSSCTMAGQAPCMGALQSCCAMPSWCPPQRFQQQLTCRCWCSSMQLSAVNKSRLASVVEDLLGHSCLLDRGRHRHSQLQANLSCQAHQQALCQHHVTAPGQVH